jgi:hypothetical protein
MEDFSVFRKYAKHIKKYSEEKNIPALKTLRLSITHDPRLTAMNSFILIGFINEALEYM